MTNNRNTDPTTSFDGRIIEILYALDHGETVQNIYLGSAGVRDGDRLDESLNDVAGTVNQLCDAFGIKPATVEQQFRGCTVTQYERNARTAPVASIRNAVLNGLSIGQFMTRTGYYALPIEQWEGGTGEVELELTGNDGELVTLKSRGNFEIVEPDDGSESFADWDIELSAEIAPAKAHLQ